MKEVILTPIKVVESKKDSNFNNLMRFISENYAALKIGAQRRSECESTTFTQPDKIIFNKVEFHFTWKSECLVKVYYNGDEITSYESELTINRVLDAIDALRVYAENPDYYENVSQSIVYHNEEQKKARKIDKIYDDSFFDDEI
jgi:hypothetical protein